jgi:cytochrome c-type biogenesis protein CcmH/NrfG
LRDAHRRVRLLPADEKERAARRYLAICDLAKRDPERAAARLEAFLACLDTASDTPRNDENTVGD